MHSVYYSIQLCILPVDTIELVQNKKTFKLAVEVLHCIKYSGKRLKKMHKNNWNSTRFKK